MTMEILKVQDLCKTYGKGEAKVEALKKVSFSLDAIYRMNKYLPTTICLDCLDKAAFPFCYRFTWLRLYCLYW